MTYWRTESCTLCHLSQLLSAAAPLLLQVAWEEEAAGLREEVEQASGLVESRTDSLAAREDAEWIVKAAQSIGEVAALMVEKLGKERPRDGWPAKNGRGASW